MEDEDCATLAACISMLLFSCLMVRTISSTVAAVSVTLAAWVIACCFTPSIFALISLTALAVSVMLEASSFPISSIMFELALTARIDVPILAIVSLKYVDISVISSLPRIGSRTVKSPSPCAISCKALAACCIGFTIFWAIKYTMNRAAANIPKLIIPIAFVRVSTVPRNSLTGARITAFQPVALIFANEDINRTP